jgi:hypothetical protein
MRVKRLQELEEMAAKLLAAARKLPPSPERHNVLQEIGRFRSEIVSLQNSALSDAHRTPKAKGK